MSLFNGKKLVDKYQLFFNETPPVNFNETNPIITEYQRVRILIMTLSISAVEIFIPFIANKPVIETSVIPIPAGTNDIAPKRIDGV